MELSVPIMKSIVILTAIFTLLPIPNSFASYLDTPRIHFAGHYRADAETINNMPCNFDVNLKYDPNPNKDWNGMGTNEFSFQNTKVYSAVGKNGNKITAGDSVIGASVLDNGKAPFAKMVIQDVDTENTTVIYGMRFGIGVEEGQQDYAFYGNWTPNIISQMLWHKVKCYDDSMQQDTYPRGALATTTLRDIQWKDDDDLKSDVLKELKAESLKNGNTLQVSVQFYFYTRNHKEYVNHNFTLGYVVGTVGVYKQGEPLNYGGERLLSPFNKGAPPPDLKFDDTYDSCYEKDLSLYNPWMYKAPFKINNVASIITMDFSNSLPISTYAMPRNIGKVFIGILSGDPPCFDVIGEVPYMEESNWLWNTGGLVDFGLTSEQLSSVQENVNIVAVIESDKGDIVECESKIFRGIDATSHRYVVMLKEDDYYVRPQGFYNARLEITDRFELQLYVTSHGLPAKGVQIVVSDYRQEHLIPKHGVEVKGQFDGNVSSIFWYAVNETDSNGLANFTFNVIKEMSPLREYYEPPCKEINETLKVLPIDGQSYQFKYAVCNGKCDTSDELDTSHEDITPISIRAFSSSIVSSESTLLDTWEKDIQPIFTQYYHLYPVMSSIVNLSNVTSVLKYTNLQMLIHSMSLDFNDPNFMPATRDLAPSKQKMIVEWLTTMLNFYFDKEAFILHESDNPFDHTPELVPQIICQDIKYKTAVSTFEEYASASVCQAKEIPFDSNKLCDPKFTDLYYILDILISKKGDDCTRPLYGYTADSTNPNIQKKCTLGNLQDQLQLAVEVEFATLPVYLTAMYSIEKECNEEIYDTIHAIAMQEMLHFIQASNILIATGRYPIIDSEDFVPSFPRKGLPGCVHPNLKVYLGKFTPEIVHDLFVAIEAPQLTCVARNYPEFSNNTIGQLYDEIEGCISHLGDGIFVNNSKQVSWPWPILHDSPLGLLHEVTDVATALEGIDEIVDQGEGVDPIDPKDAGKPDDQLAHYYRFQEIVCKKHLVPTPDGNGYAYNGTSIPYNPKGVYPMRPNPRSRTILPHTNCYTEAKTFHHVFRALLRELQVTFSGKPENIMKAIEVMESMKVHLERVMRVYYDPSDDVEGLTCGPVWDYNWEEPYIY